MKKCYAKLVSIPKSKVVIEIKLAIPTTQTNKNENIQY